MPAAAPLLSATELQAALGDPALRIFDTTVVMRPKPTGGYDIESGRAGYRSEHIPGAGFLDLLSDFSAPDSPYPFTMPTAERFATAAGAAGIGPNDRVVLYNAGPTWWSTRFWFMFRDFGFEAVQVLDGGLDRWRALGLPLVSGDTAYPEGAFPIRPRRGIFVGKSEVAAALTGATCTLVNALSADAHAGRTSSQPRPGRIPGSRHLFALDLLDPTTREFLPVAQLSERLRAAGLLDQKPVIAYCGGGISATTDAFALYLVGHHAVRIYDGSLTEWSRDPTLPLEVDP